MPQDADAVKGKRDPPEERDEDSGGDGEGQEVPLSYDKNIEAHKERKAARLAGRGEAREMRLRDTVGINQKNYLDQTCFKVALAELYEV
jgi:hypothetical protein